MLYPDFKRAINTLWEHHQHGVNPRKMVDVAAPRAIPDVVEGQEARRPGTAAPPKPAEPAPAKWTPRYEFNDPHLPEKVGRHLASLNDHDAEQLLDAVAADLGITGVDGTKFKLWGSLQRAFWVDQPVEPTVTAQIEAA